MISVKGVYKTFEIPVFEDLSFKVEKNEIVSIIGESGCGKTTLLNLISGFLKLDSGSINVNGNVVNRPSSEVGFVFQEDTVFPWLTVEENVAFADNYLSSESNLNVEELLYAIGLQGFENYYPKNLSGGMKKRVELARAFKARHKTLLMDEPFGSLDYHTRHKMQLLLLKLKQDNHGTILFVTHDISEAVFLSDRILLISKSKKNIEEIFHVNFTRPRKVSLKYSLEFVSFCQKIQNQLTSVEK